MEDISKGPVTVYTNDLVDGVTVTNLLMYYFFQAIFEILLLARSYFVHVQAGWDALSELFLGFGLSH